MAGRNQGVQRRIREGLAASRPGERPATFRDFIPTYPNYNQYSRTGSARFSATVQQDRYGRVYVYPYDAITIQDLDEMRFDGQIRAGLMLIKLPIQRAQWQIVCEDQDISAWVNEVIKPIWPDLVRTTLMALDFGYSVHEILWGTLYNLAVTATQAQLGASRKVTYPQSTCVRKLLHVDPLTCWLMTYRRAGDFAGFRQFTPEYTVVPESKSFHFANEMEFDEVYGVPRTKPCYPYWQWKKLNYEWMNVANETYAVPIRKGFYPEGQTEFINAAGEDTSLDNRDIMLDLLSEMGNNFVAALPTGFQMDQGGQRLWDIEFLEAQRSGQDILGTIDHMNLMILKSLLVPQLALEIGSSGSYSLADTQIDFFMLGEEALMDQIANAVNKQIIKPLVRAQFGARAPTALLKFAPLYKSTREGLGNMLMETLGAGRPITMKDGSSMLPDWQRISEDTGIPVVVLDQEDMALYNQAEQANNPQPTMDPNDPNAQQGGGGWQSGGFDQGGGGDMPFGAPPSNSPSQQGQVQQPGDDDEANLTDLSDAWKVENGKLVFAPTEDNVINLAMWIESQHQRVSKGTHEGGQFGSKPGTPIQAPQAPTGEIHHEPSARPGNRALGTGARISYEAVPTDKADTGIPGIHKEDNSPGAYQRKKKYTEAVLSVFRSGGHADALAEAAGFKVKGLKVLPGFWEGKVNPSVQMDLDLKEADLDKEDTRARVDALCAAIGYVLDQDGVGWHMPRKTTSYGDASGVLLDMGRPVKPEEIAAIYDKIHLEHGDKIANNTILVADGQGLRCLHLNDPGWGSGISNPEWHGILGKAVQEALDDDVTVKAGYFKNDSNLVDNDWSIATDGEDYLSRISAGGSPDLQRAAEDFRRDLQGVKADFSSEFGWGKYAQEAKGLSRPPGDAPSDEALVKNPIPGHLPDEHKLAAIDKLTEENVPMVEDLLAKIKEVCGENISGLKWNRKAPDRIVSKANRPSIKAKKPWHEIEHVRDTLRFTATAKDYHAVEQALSCVLDAGIKIVKFDAEKMIAPKGWGWRSINLDLQMPNGQLIEAMVPFEAMQDIKKENHLLFKKWRNTTEEERLAHPREYYSDVARSRSSYDKAFMQALQASGMSEDDLLASLTKLADSSLPGGTA